MRPFATESGKSRGQFYTPPEVSRNIAQAIGITRANPKATTTAYDPTCRSGSLLLKVAGRLGFQAQRSGGGVSGQNYATCDRDRNAADEKSGRRRAAIIARSVLLIRWDEDGNACILNERDQWVPWTS